MEKINNYLTYLDSKQNNAYSFIRIFVGIALMIRGILLIRDPQAIIEIARNENLHVFISYVTIGHLIGGVLLIFGIYSRLGALIQIPILFSAVFIVNLHNGLMHGSESFELSALVLFLLLIYFVWGSGAISIDNYIASKKRNS